MNDNGILWFIVFALLIACAYILMTSNSPANAEYLAELWKGYNISPEAAESIKNSRNPDGADCCGKADGIPVEFDIKNGHYWANWDGAWRQIDDKHVVKHLKDVAFPIIWLTRGNKQHLNEDGTYTDLGYRDVRCFWPGAGG